MLRNIGGNWRAYATKLALALAAVAVIGVTEVTPAKAWYDAYGYWHPNHRYYRSYGDRDYWRRTEAERHYWWCERHPDRCYYSPRYGYYYR